MVGPSPNLAQNLDLDLTQGPSAQTFDVRITLRVYPSQINFKDIASEVKTSQRLKL